MIIWVILYAPVQKWWDLFFKCIFDPLIFNMLKQAVNMIFIRWFVRIILNFICLWLFMAFIRPFKINKVWIMQYQNACIWDSFWWLFHCTQQIAMGTHIISISQVEMKLLHNITACVLGLFWVFGSISKYLNYGEWDPLSILWFMK